MLDLIKQYKYTLLITILLIVPLGGYAVWMMYGWLFVPLPLTSEDFNKMVAAGTVAFFAIVAALFVKTQVEDTI